jgi:hypothetical protein
MWIKYDDISIDAKDLIPHLESYAKAVLLKMQKADKELAYCWTACSITFNDLQPEFTWGSIEDIDSEDGIYVEMPLPEPPEKDNE